MATTYERVTRIVVNQLGVEESAIKPDSSFVDDLNADSPRSSGAGDVTRTRVQQWRTRDRDSR